MTSTTFAVGVGVDHGPHSPGAHHQNNSSTSTSTAGTSNSTSTALCSPNPTKSFGNNTAFDAHRQNHNSSKLPAFRFADLKKDAFVLPSLLQHIPPSPVSPQPDTLPERPTDGCQQRPPQAQQQQQQQQQQQAQTPSQLPLQQREAHDHPSAGQQIPGPLPDSLHSHASSHNPPDKSPSPETPQLKSPLPHQASPPKTRASTFPNPKPAAATTTTKSDPSTGVKRPASFPDAPTVVAQSYATRNQSSSTTAPPAHKRRLTASGITTRTEPSILQAGDDQNPTGEWAQGQRELLLPKTVDSTKAEERRRSRPPVSYRPPNVTGGRAVIPPIRSFRSSGSRKSSLNLDMHVRRASEESSFGEDITDPNQRDRTLRVLEGRHDDDYSQITPPDSADATGDRDNTADLFMRIAQEDQSSDERAKSGEQSAITRITRASHRRPLSAAVASYQATSPPQITRRLSDQRDSIRTRQLTDPQSPQQMTRELVYRTNVREKAASVAPTTEETGRSQTIRTPLRPSPLTPRTISFQEGTTSEAGAGYRRRQSVTESIAGVTVSRTTQFRNANLGHAQGRTYHSSPLVPKTIDLQKNEAQEANQAVEGTESSGSTAAPSTVWDELDDLKSRIHRLELTGKVPSTSGAAMSRASDDRPPTATTNATTMSASPKRGSAPGTSQPDATSTTSSHREPQPLLLSALSKTKGLVSTEVFEAIEAAATDALSLQLMMGAPGQPGPISSGASTIGVGSNMTDRQLRRKADSICRSLTELCIALADEPTAKQPQPAVTPRREKETELLLSPTTTKFAPLSTQRRPSALVDSSAPKSAMSPRAPTSLEQRRISLLTSTALPSPRYAAVPATPAEPVGAGRKTSLLVTRSRRAGTEEPEETVAAGRRSSLLLRTRRAGTEEPEEQPQGRKTSLLFRSRKATNDDEEEPRFRVPSRAVTEVNSFRTTSRDLPTQNQADTSLASSALPRRRLVPSSLNPRLVAPSTTTTTTAAAAPPTTPGRRFLDRAATEREVGSVAEKIAEDRSQRQISFSSTSLLNRSGSISRRNRDSVVPSALSQNTATGNYR